MFDTATHYFLDLACAYYVLDDAVAFLTTRTDINGPFLHSKVYNIAGATYNLDDLSGQLQTTPPKHFLFMKPISLALICLKASNSQLLENTSRM